MINGTITIGFSIEDCFKINELIVTNKRKEFKQSFTNDGEFTNLLITMDKPNKSLSICLDDLICSYKTTYSLKKTDDIQDFFGVYEYNFEYNGEDLNNLILLTPKYDDKYFSSLEEYLVSHLNSLTYKRDCKNYEMLLNYLEFYDLDNNVSTLYSLYILEMLYTTSYFNKAEKIFNDRLKYYILDIRRVAYQYENMTLAKKGIEVLNDAKLTSITYLGDVLIGMYVVRIKKKGPTYSLINKSVNEKVVYKAILNVLSKVTNKDYLDF